ncbi:MAG: PAS domain S-box protein [Bacteroidota bacterium]
MPKGRNRSTHPDRTMTGDNPTGVLSHQDHGALGETILEVQRMHNDPNEPQGERSLQFEEPKAELRNEMKRRIDGGEALRLAEQKHRSIFENFMEGMFLATPDGRYIEVNPALARIYGYSKPDELIRGLSNGECQIYADPARQMGFKNLVLEQGTVRDFEYEAVRRDGEAIWLSQSAHLEKNRKNENVLIEGITVDITRRKRAEEALRNSERDYRSIFENAVEGICRSTYDGKFLKVNPALVKMLGYGSEKELLQIDIATQLYFDPRDRAEFKEKIARDNKVTSLELRMKKKNGELIYVNVHDRIQRDDQGNFLYYEAIIEDITDRKQVEEALQKAHTELEFRVSQRTRALARANVELRSEILERERAERALRESEERYRTLVELSPECIAVYSNRIILFVNTASLKFSGADSREQLLGQDVARLFNFGTDEVVDRMMERIESESGDGLIQEKFSVSSGQTVHVEVSCAPITYLGQSARLVVIRDITERKRAEENLMAYQQKLQSVASELSLVQERERRTIAGYLHDHIGQALAVSKMKLKEAYTLSSEFRVKESLERVLELIEQSYQEARSLTIDLSPPILYELGFEAAVEWLAERTGKQHGFTVSYQSDASSKPLANDIRIVLFQASREVLMNIVKHAEARSIEIAISRVADSISVVIRDDGKGFDTSRLYSYGTHSGGFGLFNVRERLVHLGGHVRIESVIGRSTKVTIVAPLAKVDEKDGPA